MISSSLISSTTTLIQSVSMSTPLWLSWVERMSHWIRIYFKKSSTIVTRMLNHSTMPKVGTITLDSDVDTFFSVTDFVLVSSVTIWTDLFVRHFINCDDTSHDDLLMFVRKKSLQGSRYYTKFQVSFTDCWQLYRQLIPNSVTFLPPDHRHKLKYFVRNQGNYRLVTWTLTGKRHCTLISSTNASSTI